MNRTIKIEDKIEAKGDARVIVAREHISWWPLNNDVMIWPKGNNSNVILRRLIADSSIWLRYPWLWQAHLWDLMQQTGGPSEMQAWRLVEAREMNSTFQPFSIEPNGNCKRIIGPSSWQLGDWIFHALDMSREMRIQVIKWALQFVGDGTYSGLPKSVTGAK
jgi:hypothetical protein